VKVTHTWVVWRSLRRCFLVTVLSAGVPFSYNGRAAELLSPLPRFNQADRGASEEELRDLRMEARFYRTLAESRILRSDRGGIRAAYLAH
jgi:hypothetical protein